MAKAKKEAAKKTETKPEAETQKGTVETPPIETKPEAETKPILDKKDSGTGTEQNESAGLINQDGKTIGQNDEVPTAKVNDGKLKPAAIPVESFQKARASKSVSVDGRITLENKNGHKTSYTEAQAEYFLSKYPERYKIV